MVAHKKLLWEGVCPFGPCFDPQPRFFSALYFEDFSKIQILSWSFRDLGKILELNHPSSSEGNT